MLQKDSGEIRAHVLCLICTKTLIPYLSCAGDGEREMEMEGEVLQQSATLPPSGYDGS